MEFSSVPPKAPPIPPDAEQRLRQAHTFLTAAEKDKLKRLSSSKGMTQSGYLRMLLNAVDE